MSRYVRTVFGSTITLPKKIYQWKQSEVVFIKKQVYLTSAYYLWIWIVLSCCVFVHLDSSSGVLCGLAVCKAHLLFWSSVAINNCPVLEGSSETDKHWLFTCHHLSLWYVKWHYWTYAVLIFEVWVWCLIHTQSNWVIGTSWIKCTTNCQQQGWFSLIPQWVVLSWFSLEDYFTFTKSNFVKFLLIKFFFLYLSHEARFFG